MNLHVARRYLLIPICPNTKTEKVIFRHSQYDPEILYEMDLPIASELPVYHAALDLSAHMGEDIYVSLSYPTSGAYAWVFADTRPHHVCTKHTAVHFAPQTGWMNDPNGLVYENEKYHMYFQYNPYNTKWGNMHWGHAESTDLIHWEQRDIVLYPDGNGTCFSGSAILDQRNLTGHGENALLFYYTAAGGTSERSRDRAFTQKMAFSTDHGETLQRDASFCLETIAKENRDPKVFYHEKSSAYIMVLYLVDKEFAIFRSTDLLHFTLTKRLILEDAWECPDLFEVACKGEDSKTWIFWSADGYYFPGEFDGYTFTQTHPRRRAYMGEVPYAAQTISGCGDRIISVSWLRISPETQKFSGLMSIPSVLSAINGIDGPVLQFALPREWEDARQLCWRGIATQREMSYLIPGCFELVLKKKETMGLWCEVRYGIHHITVDEEEGIIRFDEVTIPCTDMTEISLIFDVFVIELRADQDTKYFVCENKNTEKSQQIFIRTCEERAADFALFEIHS